MNSTAVHLKLAEAVRALSAEAVNLLVNLVKIPSVNHPPHGDEIAVQEFYHAYLLQHGLESKIIEPSAIPAFSRHPARLPEHDMTGRPNVTATIKGAGKGRSLLVLAHADTEVIGDYDKWTDDPFSGALRNGRVYGRGSGDDKSGMAIAAILPLALRQAGIRLCGDLTIAAVADEEQGGANGTAALLASGVKTDAAVYLDGTNNQAIWNAGLGCGICEIIISADFTQAIETAADNIRKIVIGQKETIQKAICDHPSFGNDFFREIMAGHFFNINSSRPDSHSLKLSFVMDTLPGDDEDLLKKHFEEKLSAQSYPGVKIKTAWMSRFLKPAQLSPKHPLVAELARAFKMATHLQALVSPGCQSDQGIVSHYGRIPCVLFGCGRRGKEGAPHLPNEYIRIDEFLENLLTTVTFAANWCGTEAA